MKILKSSTWTNTLTPTLIIEMTVLQEMKELREIWKNQHFMLTPEQKQRYEALLLIRRARVKEMYENDLVYKSTAK